VSVEAPPREPEQDELDALIEEARRRTRRRRLTYASLLAAAALIAVGSYLLIGGGGDSGAPGSPSGEPNAGAAATQLPSRAERAYRCPTSKAGLERSTPGNGNGIPGCNIHFWATLPSGWHEDPIRATVFPPRLMVSEPLGPPAVRLANVPLTRPAVRFANTRLDSPPRAPGAIPHSLPPDGIAIVLSAGSPLKRGAARTRPKDLRPSDFNVVDAGKLATADLDTGGWGFQALVRSGAGVIQRGDLVEAASVLNSIVTTQHLCPCGWRRHHG
jgi:hypothetical protein